MTIKKYRVIEKDLFDKEYENIKAICPNRHNAKETAYQEYEKEMKRTNHRSTKVYVIKKIKYLVRS